MTTNIMHDYKRTAPKGWCGDPKRGAAVGRGSHYHPGNAVDYGGKVYVRRVRLDSGGYDCAGTYFGHGEPLYWICAEDGNEAMRRAPSRTAALTLARELFPCAKIRGAK
jgi:hypothetical protein